MDGDDLTGPLASGQAFADLTFWRKIGVAGADGLGWLNALVSAEISDLASGTARQSLLLSPTGRIRAEFTVAITGGSPLLIQDPAETQPIDQLLSPYVLSSDVVLEDRTDEIALFSFPGRDSAPDAPGAVASTPSCLGSGIDLMAPIEARERLNASFSDVLALASNEEVESWRIAAGRPRLGVDVLDGDLPEEAALAHAVSFEKGCYVGQEAVAKVRNLGHPRRILLRVEADAAVSPGDRVLVAATDVGEITSAAVVAERSVGIARVRWEARDGPLVTESGTQLHARAVPDR
jgi:tRNA-modifying protein YgfZ